MQVLLHHLSILDGHGDGLGELDPRPLELEILLSCVMMTTKGEGGGEGVGRAECVERSKIYARFERLFFPPKC